MKFEVEVEIAYGHGDHCVGGDWIISFVQDDDNKVQLECMNECLAYAIIDVKDLLAEMNRKDGEK